MLERYRMFFFQQCQIRDTCYFNTSLFDDWWGFYLIWFIFLFENIKWCGNNARPFVFYFILSCSFKLLCMCVKYFVAKVPYIQTLPETFACTIKMSSLFCGIREYGSITEIHFHARELLFNNCTMHRCKTQKIILTSNNICLYLARLGQTCTKTIKCNSLHIINVNYTVYYSQHVIYVDVCMSNVYVYVCLYEWAYYCLCVPSLVLVNICTNAFLAYLNLAWCHVFTLYTM